MNTLMCEVPNGLTLFKEQFNSNARSSDVLLLDDFAVRQQSFQSSISLFSVADNRWNERTQLTIREDRSGLVSPLVGNLIPRFRSRVQMPSGLQALVFRVAPRARAFSPC